MGGKEIFQGCKYQTIAFLNDFLGENTLKGTLEELDDYFIERKDEKICVQTKDLKKNLGVYDLNSFILNFMKAYEKDKELKFKVISSKGISKTINYDKVFEKTELEISKKQIFDIVVSKIEEEIFSKEHLYSKLKNKIGDLAVTQGALITSNEMDPIINDLLSRIMDLKEMSYSKVLEEIKIKIAPFLGYTSQEGFKNSANLTIKKSKHFSREEVDDSVHKAVQFKRLIKRLSGSNPILSFDLNNFYSKLESSFDGSEKKFEEFEEVYEKYLNEMGEDFKNFIEERNQAKEEIYNCLIGGCSIYPIK